MVKKKISKKPLPNVKEKAEYEQHLVDLARVTRVVAGGKRLRFRACVVIGNKQGEVSVGLAKGADVTTAINKAVKKAEKDIVKLPPLSKDESIPRVIEEKFKATKIILKPAKKGKGLICGGVIRTILELAGIKNVVGKIIGSHNKINVAQATINALKKLFK